MEGFIMQQTNFPFICCIVDDASTDGEQSVIKRYIQDNFNLSDGSESFNRETDVAFVTYARHKKNRNCYFVVYFLKENHYSQKKSKNQYFDEFGKKCSYVALCEGDDYWIDKNKLQKQVDFLAQHSSCSMVCTRTLFFSQRLNKIVAENRYKHNSCFLDSKSVILKGGEFISTASICLKRFVLDDFPLYCLNCYIGDYPLQIMCAMKGCVYYLDDIMTVYRMDNVSSWCGAAAKNMNIFSIDKYNRKRTLQDMLYGFSIDYPKYRKQFLGRIAFSINNEITRKTPKHVAKSIILFYDNYISRFKWYWKLDLLIRLYTPNFILGVYTKLSSKLFLNKYLS